MHITSSAKSAEEFQSEIDALIRDRVGKMQKQATLWARTKRDQACVAAAVAALIALGDEIASITFTD